MIKKIRGFIREFGLELLIVAGALLVVCAVTLPKIGSLLSTDSEHAESLGVASGSGIINNALFLPLKLTQYGLHKIDEGNVTLLRLVSVAVLIISVIAMYLVLSKWHTRRLALAGTLLFITSTYSLVVGRSANPEVMYLSILPLLLLIGTWLKSKRNVNKFPLASVIITCLLYIPGAWIFVVSSAIVFRKRLALAWKVISIRLRFFSIFIFLLLLAPLFLTFIQDAALILRWIGVDDKLTLSLALSNLKDIFLSLFWRGPNDVLWIKNTPMLDIFTLSMFVLGVEAYFTGHHPLRARLLLGYATLSITLVTIGVVPLAILLPLVYITATNGIAKMLQSWFVVFPRNPFARGVGVTLLAVAIIMSCRYQLLRYYDALPTLQKPTSVFKVVQLKERKGVIYEQV